MTKQWFPLESNPSVMNSYMQKLGLDTSNCSFHDVFSTENWALDMVPKPVLSVLLLFPISESSESHRQQEDDRIKIEGQTVSPQVYYMKQTIGNACGTVGLLHSVGNARSLVTIKPESYLDTLFQATASMSPEEIADYLEGDAALEETHSSAAQEGQSEQVDEPDDVNNHFVCFTHVDGSLYELDGRKSFPINHGASSAETLLQDACKVIEGFIARSAGDLRFTIVAFCQAPPADEES